MTRSRLLVPLVVGVAIVLLGIVVARVVAQDEAPAADFAPVTVPTTPETSPSPTATPTPTPTPTARDDDDDDDDDFQRVPQTPRPIDDDDDDGDDGDDGDDDD